MIPFFDSYAAVLVWVLATEAEVNARTGQRVKVARGGVSFRVDLAGKFLPTIGFRKTFPRSAAAEVAWYLMGEQEASFIRKHAPMWDKFIEPLGPDLASGETAPMGVKAAYGYRWRKHFGRDQLLLAVEALRKDPSDRRVYVSAWDPAADGLGAIGQRNVPCPAAFTFSITGGELHSSLFIRSSDLFVGLPYDAMGHALLMDAVAQELRIRPGVMHLTMAHAHLYDSHWEMAVEMLKQDPVVPKLQLPGWSMSKIIANPDDYVARLGAEAKQFTWPTYNPKPEVIE